MQVPLTPFFVVSGILYLDYEACHLHTLDAFIDEIGRTVLQADLIDHEEEYTLIGFGSGAGDVC